LTTELMQPKVVIVEVGGKMLETGRETAVGFGVGGEVGLDVGLAVGLAVGGWAVICLDKMMAIAAKNREWIEYIDDDTILFLLHPLLNIVLQFLHGASFGMMLCWTMMML